MKRRLISHAAPTELGLVYWSNPINVSRLNGASPL